MSEVLPLDVLLGPQGAARVLQQLADDLVHQDRLEPGTALRLVCERATDGEPLLIAGPGQEWSLRADVDPDDAPGQRLAIHARLAAPPRVVATVLDGDDTAPDELLIEVLNWYRLDAWEPVDALLDGSGSQ